MLDSKLKKKQLNESGTSKDSQETKKNGNDSNPHPLSTMSLETIPGE